jgi:hypothetical protein
MAEAMIRQQAARFVWQQQAAEKSWQEKDYSLVIFPEGDGGERVKQLAGKFHRNFREGLYPQEAPLIELAAFRAREAMEDTLIRWIQRVCHMQRRFQVQLNGFCEKHNGGLYLQVQDQRPFTKISGSLSVVDQYIQSCGSPPVEWMQAPQCRLTNSITTNEYDQTKNWFSTKPFQADFFVHSLVLLKQVSDSGSAELVNVFPLLP